MFTGDPECPRDLLHGALVEVVQDEHAAVIEIEGVERLEDELTSLLGRHGGVGQRAGIDRLRDFASNLVPPMGAAALP